MLLSTYEKEMLALVLAVQNWGPYLLGRFFIGRTDQRSLKFLWEQKITTVMQQRWLAKLMGYDFIIENKRGVENKLGLFQIGLNPSEKTSKLYQSCKH